MNMIVNYMNKLNYLLTLSHINEREKNICSYTPSISLSDKNTIQIISSYYIDVILQCFLNIKKLNDYFSNLSFEEINKNNLNLIQ